MNNKIKIINIISHSPININGTTVHLKEWPIELGHWVLQVTTEYDWEVWQPDISIDKVTTFQLEDRLHHVMFPASEYSYKPGFFRSVKGVRANGMIDELEKISAERIIVILHGFGLPFWYELLKKIGKNKKYPIYLLGHGNALAPIQRINKAKNPLTFLSCFIEQIRMENLYSYIDEISEQNFKSMTAAEIVFKKKVNALTMGVDFSFWYPNFDNLIKQNIRKKLSIDNDTKVFITSCLWGSRKQLDKLIFAFLELLPRDGFFFILVGQGENTYSKYVYEIAEPLIIKNKMKILPYALKEELRNYYWASDAYISSSLSEGASVSVMEAMACGLSILSTPVGGTYELLTKFSVGDILPLQKYSDWSQIIDRNIELNSLLYLDREIAKIAYDWPSVTNRFIFLLHEMSSLYY